MKKPKFKFSFYKSNWRLKPYYFKNNLIWTVKWGKPVCEYPPQFHFEWLGFGIIGMWGDYQYWEQKIWIDNYNDGDYDKAKKSWHWIDYDTKRSTWNDEII